MSVYFFSRMAKFFTLVYSVLLVPRHFSWAVNSGRDSVNKILYSSQQDFYLMIEVSLPFFKILLSSFIYIFFFSLDSFFFFFFFWPVNENKK